MKKKELKNLAKRIAVQEQIVQDNADSESVRKAQEEIMKLCSHVDFSEMDELDEMIQAILKEQS